MKKEFKIDGSSVDDSLKPLRVSISKADVKTGATKNADGCAAAVAIMRQTGCTEAKVHVTRTYVKQGKKWLRFVTPLALRTEVVAFDRGGTFEPGDYKLDPVPPAWRKGARATRVNNTDKKNKGTKPPREPHVTTGIRQHATTGATRG